MDPVQDSITQSQSQVPKPPDNAAAQPRQPEEALCDRPPETQDAGDHERTSRTQIQLPQIAIPEDGDRAPEVAPVPIPRLVSLVLKIVYFILLIYGFILRLMGVPIQQRNSRIVYLYCKITYLIGFYVGYIQGYIVGRSRRDVWFYNTVIILIRLVHIFCSLAISYIFAYTMIQFGVLDPCFAKARTGQICKSKVYIYGFLSYTQVQDEYTCVFFEGHRLKTVAEGWDFGGTSC